MSELTGNRIRTTAGKLGLPHLAETINEFTRRADEAKITEVELVVSCRCSGGSDAQAGLGEAAVDELAAVLDVP
ncbi:hypothetical protein DWB77_00100 [Streptomyces hundungensis]|uniref:Uncharacterized protein n=1 Tax=Streptomyces hundungensis TaxID=1077946 RepID=A0A387H746_9ACTN|nr:hypothetical protein DWB77_00100 [Streptomyces hundungensis]